ncbi:MAG: hypothetical protein U5L72_17380 [Bacteroidales bacterium]|nr:hypothetical protein [Bacteroidales bacterium]
MLYTDLPPGKYIFEVSAINADGVASEEPDTLEYQCCSHIPAVALCPYNVDSLLALALVIFLSMQIRRSVLERKIETCPAAG